tara:strand:- start:1392 stop:1604 length:213 start_codon:yes stop_codon:yes gene_type:complete
LLLEDDDANEDNDCVLGIGTFILITLPFNGGELDGDVVEWDDNELDELDETILFNITGGGVVVVIFLFPT